jgi:hypothetical protein
MENCFLIDTFKHISRYLQRLPQQPRRSFRGLLKAKVSLSPFIRLRLNTLLLAAGMKGKVNRAEAR